MRSPMIQAHAGHNHRDVRSAMLAARPRISTYCAHGGTPAHGNDRRRGGAHRPLHLLGRVSTHAPPRGCRGRWADADRRASSDPGAAAPVRFDFNADSSNAEVTVKWRIQFEIERTGQTDVTWDDNGHIQGAVITLATFDPKGRPMEPEDIRVVATHEVGHLLGLDHSKDSTDIMFPTAKVRDLSDRDVRTVLFLYQLTPGSLR